MIRSEKEINNQKIIYHKKDNLESVKQEVNDKLKFIDKEKISDH